jgi:hypothetical protein
MHATANLVDERTTKTTTIKALGRKRGSQCSRQKPQRTRTTNEEDEDN